MRLADAFTCENSKFSSVELKEQAANAFVEAFVSYCDSEREVSIICGKGNNGGDGLSIARLLQDKGYIDIKVYILEKFSSETVDFSINHERLKLLEIPIFYCTSLNDLPQNLDVVIDAVFGSGFNRELDSFLQSIFQHLNTNCKYIVSVDAPSGCNVDDFNSKTYNGIQAQLTIFFNDPNYSLRFLNHKS